MRIARGHIAKDKFSGYSQQDREDIVGAWALLLVRKWRRIDPDKNPHAYITTMVANCWRMHERGMQRRIRKESEKVEAEFQARMNQTQQFIRRYERDLGEAGDIVPLEEFEKKIKSGGNSGIH
jgi:DNA-directed RNA polymerase specialized sigma24 family protein